MSDADTERLGRKGATDKLVGRAKEMIGDAVGSDSLAVKGRLQQAEGEAKREAAHHRIEADVQRVQAQDATVEGARTAAEIRTEAMQDEQDRTAALERERARAHVEAEQETAPAERAAEAGAAAEQAALEARERRARQARDEALEVVDDLEADADRSKDNVRELDRLQRDVQ